MRYPVFSFHLQWAVARKMTVREFANRLEFRHPYTVLSWLNGDTLPEITILHSMATLLKADPLEMLAVWIAEAAPEYEAILQAEVLCPRGSNAKLSNDNDIQDFRILVPMGK